MPTHTYTIELKIDMIDDSKHDVMIEAMVQTAKSFAAVGVLLQDRKAPQVVCRTEDAFFNSEEIDVMAHKSPGDD